MQFIDDPRKWRVSKSGFTIRAGWADDKKFIAKYPGATSPIDYEQFREWLENAERICDLHNATLCPTDAEAIEGRGAEEESNDVR